MDVAVGTLVSAPPKDSRRLIPTALLIIYALALSLAVGLGTAYWAVSGDYPLGGHRIGAWTVWPRVGSREVDPYARAVMARTGAIPLGVGEGLALVATIDDLGRPLDARCAYRIGSVVPPARYWTLALYDGLNPSADRRRGFTSAEILREADGGFFITIGPEARSGNWIPTAEAGPVRLVLRLYDTPVAASSAALDRNALPAIEQLECLP